MFSIQFRYVFAIHLRRELDVSFFNRRNCLVRQRLNLDEPLQRKPRLHHGLAAVAVAHVVHVVLDAGQQTHLFEIGNNLLARDKPVQPRVNAALSIDVRGIVHHVDRRQIVPLP